MDDESNIVIYNSAELQITKSCIKGSLMKAVENIGFFNSDIYHKRFFIMNYGQPFCYFYEKKTDNHHHKSHLQSELLSCDILHNEVIHQRLQEREDQRKKSILRKVMKDKIKTCQWNFAFQITFKDKTYELYAPTRKDREQWVEAFQTIAEMNKKGIKLQTMKPFDYVRNKQLE